VLRRVRPDIGNVERVCVCLVPCEQDSLASEIVPESYQQVNPVHPKTSEKKYREKKCREKKIPRKKYRGKSRAKFSPRGFF
jgi:hypothetical protein